ncbi:MAG: UvrD-helicase domain-containing protein [Bacilli bacterium]|nr:UvrD-helicase domain-containing protein [Bacilli bacterium]
MGFLFFEKRNSKEYITIAQFTDDLNRNLECDAFLTSTDFDDLKAKFSSFFEMLIDIKQKDLLNEWCNKKKIKSRNVSAALDKYLSLRGLFDIHNDVFVRRHLISDKSFLDRCLKNDDPNINLDNEQRRVVLSDEKYTLVVAGAGSGKTTTIEAKVKYLVDVKHVDPHKILVVSFTKKATNELRERINEKLDIPAKISTFHSIGYTIIKGNEQEPTNVFGGGFAYKCISDFMKEKLTDSTFVSEAVLFFASYLNEPFEVQDTATLFKMLQDDNVTTLKGDLLESVQQYQNDLEKKHVTMCDERVRSAEEASLANFLFINGIDYEYEPIYPYCFEGSLKPYTPDFLLKQGNNVVYYEHFGITEAGLSQRYNEDELKKYKQQIIDKISLHKLHGTKLIYTFSSYNDGHDKIYHLKEELIQAGFTLITKSDSDIYLQLLQTAKDKYFNKFVQLIEVFVSRFKILNLPNEQFDEWKVSCKNSRTRLFIKLAQECYLEYQKQLQLKNGIDFEDMINKAANILDEYIKTGKKLPYDYIFVDEYQDISLQRFDLCEKLSKASDAKITAVGDDWQSIYRFTGSDISLFTHFKEKVGYAQVLKLTYTHRNSQELIDVAGSFVMKNPEQIKKDLKSNKRESNPVVLVTYKDIYEDGDLKGPYYHLGEAIQESFDEIVKKYGFDSRVLIIGRYNWDRKNLDRLTDFFVPNSDRFRVISKKYPKLHIESMTAHSSKGLTYDNVIIINGKDDVLGFPSKIEDDAVMKLVLNEKDSVDYAEERRLFYVALTRTKNKVFIVTPEFHPSIFITEIQKNNPSKIALIGTSLKPRTSVDLRRRCPICGYPLQKRENKRLNMSIYVCSNDPEICGFVTNDIRGGPLAITKCPNCATGYLIVKAVKGTKDKSGQRFLGCTNYKPDGSGCNYTVDQKYFSQDESKLAENSLRLGIGNKLMLDGEPLKNIIEEIVKVIRKTYSVRPGFKFAKKTLVYFLVGLSDKPIEIFDLLHCEGYGSLKAHKKEKIFKIIDSLVSQDVLHVIDQKYTSVDIGETPIDDETIRTVYEDLPKA